MGRLAAMHVSPAPPQVLADGFGTANRRTAGLPLMQLCVFRGNDIAASPLNGFVSNWLRFYSEDQLNTAPFYCQQFITTNSNILIFKK